MDAQDAAIRDVGGRACDPIFGQSGTAMGRFVGIGDGNMVPSGELSHFAMERSTMFIHF